MSRAIKQSIEKEYSGMLESLRKSEKGKLIITCVRNKLIAFLISGDEVRCITVISGSAIGPDDIVIALVRDIKKDIDAAFIEVSKDVIGYLPLKTIPSDVALKQGCLIPVKITAQSQKGKRARFSARIDYSKYENGDELKNKASHLAKYNFLYKSEEYLSGKISKVFNESEYDEIITDDEYVFESLNKDHTNIRLYNDDSFSLSKLYSLESSLDDALSQKVWLKCGGYLVFNKTEAMTVIDVNSGKYTPAKGTESENAFICVNSEAAVEICRQLRIRNISGIILVDFINLKEEDHRNAVLELLKEGSSGDNEQVNVIDITVLGIVEMTRKKEFPSLYEELNS